ncbi:MAG: hypothetical protein AABY86_03850 [Bdellovibrionota bacterium]
MNMLTLLFLVLSFLCSCAHRFPILQAEIISMTDQSLEEGILLVEIGPVDEVFCPTPTKDPNAMGIIDELIKNAQQKSGADFLGKAIISDENNDCVSIKAIALKKVQKK